MPPTWLSLGEELMLADLIDQLADLWRFPMLKLPARPENYEARTDALTKWAMAPVTSNRQ